MLVEAFLPQNAVKSPCTSTTCKGREMESLRWHSVPITCSKWILELLLGR
jgi:hypothetical protein